MKHHLRAHMAEELGEKGIKLTILVQKFGKEGPHQGLRVARGGVEEREGGDDLPRDGSPVINQALWATQRWSRNACKEFL